MGRILDRGPGRLRLGLLIVSCLGGVPCTGETLAVPAVPYLRQSEALCGGAALAMVLRYWGTPGVVAEDFAGALTPEGTGIPTDALQQLTEARGFRAFAFHGTQNEVISHLAKGRPLIALLRAAPGRYHYVVVLAWANQRVLVHDPAVGPFRTLAESEWQKRWDEAGAWAMLVLPGADSTGHAQESVLGSPPSESACAGKVCEMAALEFHHEHWSTAASLAAEAARLDPRDRFAWELLATSRFLAGQREEALLAWNQIGEPRLDLVQINGLRQTPARVIYPYLGEDSGNLLTPERFRLVRRRIEALPAAQLSRVSYRPRSGGAAQLDVNVVERPPFSSPWSIVVQSATRAASEHAIGVEAFGLAPSGESLRVAGQWQPNRSQGLLSASAPHFLALPGIVTVEALWDEQSYRLSRPPGGLLLREQRKRVSASLSDWWTADTKATVTVAADEWRDRDLYLALSANLERRLAGDHLALGGGAGGWWSASSEPFYVASARASLRTSATLERPRLHLDVSYDYASDRAPFALWAGAGTGPARPALLRAHPLLRGGVIEGAAFGRELVSGSAEGEAPLGSLGPATIRGALFVDAAKVLAPDRGSTLVDVGFGVRVRPPGWRSALRVDLATPWGSLKPELSLGWQAEWP